MSEPHRYHVSPSANRESILRFGLDWRRMPPGGSGIAGAGPEAGGVFLTAPDIDDARFFVAMGRGRRVDVWRVDVSGLKLEEPEGGWWLCREAIPPERLELVEVWDTSDDGGELRPVRLPDVS